jgi:hypothetical protein
MDKVELSTGPESGFEKKNHRCTQMHTDGKFITEGTFGIGSYSRPAPRIPINEPQRSQRRR